MIKAPALSPDLNPIEIVWSDLKSYVRKKVCSNIIQVKKMIKKFQKRLTIEYCARYILRLKTMINNVIERDGYFCNI